METIGRLAKRFDLSRSALLYYHKIGLMSDSGRTLAGYRQYAERDVERLAAICRYRAAGLSLVDIKKLLAAPRGAPENELASTLERRLDDINGQIGDLRRQQVLILGLLKNPGSHGRIGIMNRDTWVKLLSASGFSKKDMRNWHIAFEKNDPEKHRIFLEFLCIPEDEIARLRAWANGE